MTRLLYSAAYALALPFVFPGQYFKRPPVDRALWFRQKLGILDTRQGEAPLVWVHAVSVGEAAAAATFIDAFLERNPDYKVVVSTITDTGRKVAMGKLREKAEVIYLPFDLPFFIHRAIRALRPSVFLVMETEIWPNLFYCMKTAGVPLALLNGRISRRSFDSYRKLGRSIASILSYVDIFSMQDKAYSSRIVEMGADPRKVHNTGSFKFDLKLDKSVIKWAQRMRRPLVVAGSTHRGEEELIARVFKSLLSERDTSLVLVPRHPERAGEVEAILSANGLSYKRRTELGSSEVPDVDVVLVDTVGELSSIYAEADMAVMGGSFIPHGGQNPLEPAYWCKPAICGPHMENFPYMKDFFANKAAISADKNSLRDVLLMLLDSEDTRRDIGRRAHEMLLVGRGAVLRAVELVESLTGDLNESA